MMFLSIERNYFFSKSPKTTIRIDSWMQKLQSIAANYVWE